MAKDNTRAGDRAGADEAGKPAKEFDQQSGEDAPEPEEAVEVPADAAGADEGVDAESGEPADAESGESGESAEAVADDAVAEPTDDGESAEPVADDAVAEPAEPDEPVADAEPVEPVADAEPDEPVADAEPDEPTDDGDDEAAASGITAAAEVRRESVLRHDPSSSPPGSEPPAAGAATPADSATEVLAPVAPLAVPVPPPSSQRAFSAFTPAQAARQAAAASPAAARPVTSAPSTPAPSSPLDVFEVEGRPAHRGRAAWILVTTILVLAAGYVGAQWALADRVPPGTTVAGVDIGGMSSAKAVTALRAGLVDIEARGIPITAGDQSTTLLPDQAGLSVDVPATVKELTGFGLEPSRLLAQLTGGGRHDPVTVVDEQAFATSIAALADSLAVDPVDGSLVFVDGKPQPTPAVNGASVVADQAAQIIRTSWLTAPRPIKLPVAVVAPTIGQDQVDAAVKDVAGPLTDAPISVAVGDQIAELPQSVVAGVATFTPVAGKLTLALDGKQLRDEVIKRTRNLFTAPEDAHFTFVNDVPTLVPGAPGTTIDPDALAAAVQAAGLSTTDRTARVQLVPTDPAQSTAAVEALGIKEKVSEFATPLTNETIRTQNLVNAARILTGQIVQPGETFSVAKGVSPITVENGYQMAHAIVSGELTDVIGGGLSQMATTTYNAAFFAGLEDVEHKPHSVYFTRYPPGREATIFTGVVDMKFRNNTPYGILMQSWVAGGQLHVAMWSTKYWDVTTTTSDRSNVVQPKTVYSQSPTCVAKGAGNPGFSVTVTRTVSLAGVVAANEKKSWHYKPDDAVVCGAAPAGP